MCYNKLCWAYYKTQMKNSVEDEGFLDEVISEPTHKEKEVSHKEKRAVS